MIPKTQESDDRRKMRVMQEYIDSLESQLNDMSAVSQSRQEAAPPIPMPVYVALKFVDRFQQHSAPVIASSYDQIEIVDRNFLQAEILAVESAFDLIREYFDGNNLRYMDAHRRAAEKLKKGNK